MIRSAKKLVTSTTMINESTYVPAVTVHVREEVYIYQIYMHVYARTYTFKTDISALCYYTLSC